MDWFMVWITSPEKFILPLIIAGVAVMGITGKKGMRIVALIVLTLILTDQASGILKVFFQRVRPCNELEGVRVLVGCTSSFSMPSSHVANSFGAAFVLSFLYMRLSFLFLFYALLVAYSRVYVGVHYPFDTMVGALLGLLLASAVCLIDGVSGFKKLMTSE